MFFTTNLCLFLVPTQVQLLKREFFNRWYGLSAYYLALTVSTIPIQVILAVMYIGIVYVMSDQPLEADRLLMFLVICMLTAFTSESMGLLISSVLNIVVSIACLTTIYRIFIRR